MIVFLGSLVLFVISTVLAGRYLALLRNERRQALADWANDPYVAQRNRRAVLLFAFWSVSVYFLVASLTYIDLTWLDVGRIAGLTERVLLLVIAFTLLVSKE